MKALFLLGRLAFGGFFLYNGINHFQHRAQLTQYAKSKNVPLPGAVVPATGALLVIGGTSLMFGIKPQKGAMAIMGFLMGVSPIMHDFWRHEDPGQRQAEMVNFTKNVALLGAALALGSAGEARRLRQASALRAPKSVLKSMPGQKNRERRHEARMAA